MRGRARAALVGRLGEPGKRRASPEFGPCLARRVHTGVRIPERHVALACLIGPRSLLEHGPHFGTLQLGPNRRLTGLVSRTRPLALYVRCVVVLVRFVTLRGKEYQLPGAVNAPLDATSKRLGDLTRSNGARLELQCTSYLHQIPALQKTVEMAGSLFREITSICTRSGAPTHLDEAGHRSLTQQ